ncbi:sensor histidine kinase [Pseudoalteromonas luteoviolacea]|uniref:sensor histidine kinase n=1 Tax=Pseudoalteromonas luteoviolacea TaxID=43657 RepID=UPI00061D1617|nr:HAMP domain-containing sensor histidine kinase [Pseudoalteromonas luteoviolacea]AOT10165.1 two-component sensor histidine kinase [Pseudoalteromonas luteoviolacea]AOT15077.1 two-component sensor histidine kinase [Pseudoalteromonas luteoviolacea]AOT19993.1 two-component sensor histidine kinase [Pseudoalteromonas luteoviolacea]
MQLKQSLLLFKTAAVGSAIVIMIASWFLYVQLQQTRALNDHLFQLQAQIQRLLDQEERFLIERQRDSLASIENDRFSYRESYSLLLNMLVAQQRNLEQLFKLDEEVKRFTLKYEQLASMQALLGYDKEEGVYGNFRRQAHALQDIAKQTSHPQLEILLLELRRREKDFLLRLEPSYLLMHQDLLVRTEQIITTQFPDKAQDLMSTLNQYQQGFKTYISVLQKQGLDHSQGVRAELHQLKLSIRGHFEVVSKQLFNEDLTEKQNLILTCLVIIVSISCFSLLLLFVLNTRISEHIISISRVLKNVAQHEDFSIRVNIEGEDEIAQIAHHLDSLLAFIETLLERLTAAQQRLIEEAKMASLGNMVSGFAHELNTPLGVAITSQSHLKEQVEVLKKDLESGQLQKQTLTNLISEAESALSLLENNLLRTASLIDDFKKVSVQQEYDEVQEFNLKALVNGVLDCYQHELSKPDYHVEVEIPELLMLKSYPNVFVQLMTYSVGNCIQHAKREGRVLNIVISALIVNNYIHLYVKDDGKGIDKELLPIIFEPFITTQRNKGGIGLGLSIIYNLVTQKLNGEVKIQSPAHGGACLHIILANTPFQLEEN